MLVRLANSDADIQQCFAVMVQLRSHLTSATFMTMVKRQAQQSGYRLAFLEDANEVKAVAGFRITEMLSKGRFLYLEDLVTDISDRSQGYSSILFDWLVEYAKQNDCHQLELDCGVQRINAHRFFFRKRMFIGSYHFSIRIQ